MTTFLMALHIMACLVLILVVLLQRGKGSDIGAALGGGGSNTVFGSRGAGNFLTKLTAGCAVVFMMTSLSLSYLGTQESRVSVFDEEVEDVVLDDALQEINDESDAVGSGTLEEIPGDSGALEEVVPLDIPAPDAAEVIPSDEAVPCLEWDDWENEDEIDDQSFDDIVSLVKNGDTMIELTEAEYLIFGVLDS